MYEAKTSVLDNETHAKFTLTKEEIQSSGIHEIIQKFEKSMFDKLITDESFPHDARYAFEVTYANKETELFEYTEATYWIFRYVQSTNGKIHKVVFKDEERELLNCFKSILAEMEEGSDNP